MHLLKLVLPLTLLSGSALVAAETAHQHSQHHAEHQTSAATLSLNHGQKWVTDAPLRQSMAAIRQALASKLDAIHRRQFSPQQYQALAQLIEQEVEQIVQNCQLPEAADAQLHIVVAQLLSGAQHMKADDKPMTGAVQVLQAVNQYGQYFDDAGFKPIAH